VGAFTGRQFDLAATDWLAEVSTWVEQEIMT
jgi:hypothetical protein